MKQQKAARKKLGMHPYWEAREGKQNIVKSVNPILDNPKPNRILSRNLMCFRFGLSKLARYVPS
ncbi:MAG: hypothetical protein V5A47_07125 [Bacteroidales bacterium]